MTKDEFNDRVNRLRIDFNSGELSLMQYSDLLDDLVTEYLLS